MTWTRFEDRFPWHRKVRKLSDSAFRLHVSAVCWSVEHLTNGDIARDDLDIVSDTKRPERAAVELVERGIWEERPDGWFIHDFNVYQPTAEQVRHDRAKAAERQQRARDAARLKAEQQAKSRQQSQEESRRDEDVTHGSSSIPPTRPDPKEQQLAPASPPRKKPRPPDPLWDAVVAACGIDTASITTSARSGINQALKQLRDIDADARQVQARADVFRQRYPTVTLTASALAKHWPQLTTTQPAGGEVKWFNRR